MYIVQPIRTIAAGAIDARSRCYNVILPVKNTRFLIEMWENDPLSPDEIQKAIKINEITSIIALASGSTIAYDQVNTTFFRVVIKASA